MSDSPQSPSKDVDQGVPSPDEEGQMNDPQDPHSAGLTYEFEVKEQDRWLPIANGKSLPLEFVARCVLATARETSSSLRRLLCVRDTIDSGIASAALLGALGPLLLIQRGARGQPAALPMSHDSPPKLPEASCASKNDDDRYDELDANIRNFAPVARIMKNALPENAKIAKEAKECMQECVSEFISFITSEASEKCHQEKRKTVNGEDILFAMTSLGFENYAEALKIYLSKYREQSQTNRGEGQGGRPNSAYGGQPPAGAGSFQAEASNNMLGAQQGEGGADASNYMYPPQASHNGAGAGDGY